jgi:PEP-CTERM motif-containing protein
MASKPSALTADTILRRLVCGGSLAATVLMLSAAPALAFAPPPGLNDGTILLDSGGFSPTLGLVQNEFRNFYSAPGSYTGAASTLGDTENGALTLTNSPTPGIMSSISLAPLTSTSGSGTVLGTIIYSIQVSGAAGLAQVHIDATGMAGFTSMTSSNQITDGGGVFASFILADQFNQTVVGQTINLNGNAAEIVDNITGLTIGGTSEQFAINGDFMLATNQIYSVAMRTRLQASSSLGAMSIFANIDPTFTVTGPFTIQASDGFGGVFSRPGAPGVPEPATWATMLLGFGIIGAVGRRKAWRLAGK